MRGEGGRGGGVVYLVSGLSYSLNFFKGYIRDIMGFLL